MSLVLPLTISLALCLLAGVLLARYGWRGRLIDDHPICRRCGFALFGLPAQPPRCPECGAELSARRPIRIGHRKHAAMPLIGGAVLMSIAVFLGLPLTAVQIYRVGVQSFKPLWRLDRGAWGPATHIAAMTEILQRLNAGKLSQSQINSIADEELARQADSNARWLPMTGEFIDAARTLSLLSDERWQRYAKQSLLSAVPSDAVV